MQNFSKIHQDFSKDYVDSIAKLKESYPDLLNHQTIGYSLFHKPIAMMQIGTGKKKLLFTGGVHGRETVNPIVLLAMVKHYLTHFEVYKSYFETHSLFVIPLLNPDGFAKAFEEPDWKANGRGIDLNRNFPCQSWKRKFPGDSPESEPETTVLMDAMEFIEPDVYIDFHSRGECIFYHRAALDDAYNQRQLKLAKRLQKATGYSLVPPEDEVDPGDSGGNTVQYFSEFYGKPALTIETVPDEARFPLSASYCEKVFGEIYQTPFCF